MLSGDCAAWRGEAIKAGGGDFISSLHSPFSHWSWLTPMLAAHKKGHLHWKKKRKRILFSLTVWPAIARRPAAQCSAPPRRNNSSFHSRLDSTRLDSVMRWDWICLCAPARDERTHSTPFVTFLFFAFAFHCLCYVCFVCVSFIFFSEASSRLVQNTKLWYIKVKERRRRIVSQGLCIIILMTSHDLHLSTQSQQHVLTRLNCHSPMLSRCDMVT